MLRIATLFALAATPVSALSCLPPDPVRMYEAARDSDETFVIFKGHSVGTSQIRLPPRNVPDARAVSRIRIEGASLGPTGFSDPVEAQVSLVLDCANIWCADAPDLSGEFLAAVQATSQGAVITVNPCADNVLPATEDGVARLLACHETGDCRATLP